MEQGSSLAGFGLEDIIEILERRKWWLVLGAVVGLSLGWGLYALIPPIYEASTTILVEPQRVPRSYVESTITLEVDQRLQTLQERVTSHANLTRLIETVGPERLDPSGLLDKQTLMHRVSDGLYVEIDHKGSRRRGEGGGVFLVSYFGEEPEVAAQIVREVASLFITENIKDRAQQAEATSDFLERELDRLRAEVAS